MKSIWPVKQQLFLRQLSWSRLPRCHLIGLLLAILLLDGTVGQAGPPFVTDDPDTLDRGQTQVYLAATASETNESREATLPQVEVDYGMTDHLMFHIILPYASSRTSGEPTTRGYGDTEIGLLYQFMPEGPQRPMVGVFPKLNIPTGNASRDLGSGHLGLDVPVYVLKSWGPWTAYGGGGYVINPGEGNRDFWHVGAVLQRDLNSHLSLGGELFTVTRSSADEGNQVNFNLGGQYNFDAQHALLFSVGRSLHGEIDSLYYVGFLWEFGPHGE